MFTLPLNQVPKVLLYSGVGAVVNGALFYKISHVVEYIINKRFANYDNPLKTLCGRIIVKANQDYYWLQNLVLGSFLSLSSYLIYKITPFAKKPNVLSLAFLIGRIATPLIFALYNVIHRRFFSERDGTWVQILEEEAKDHGIETIKVQKISFGEMVYCGFGSRPKYFHCY